MKRQLMAEQWNEFACSILPKSCSEIQRREMRRAFYAGAASILATVIKVLSPESEPTEGDIQMMETLTEELRDFGQAITEGRA